MTDRWKDFEKIVTERTLTIEEVDELVSMSELIEEADGPTTSIHSFWTALVQSPKNLAATNVDLCKKRIIPHLMRASEPYLKKLWKADIVRQEKQREMDLLEGRGVRRGGARPTDGPGRKRS